MTDNRDSGARTALNTASAWLANAVGMAVGFYLTRFLLDQLGEPLYGVYSLGASVAAWSALIGVPIGTYAQRFGTEYLERGETPALHRTLATSLGLSLVAAAIIPLPVIVCALAAQHLFRVPPDLIGPTQISILIIGLGAAVTVVVRVWEASVFMSRRIYLKNYADTVAKLLGAVILVAWFYFFGPSVTAWLFTVVALPLLLSLGYVIPASVRGLPVRLLSVGFERTEVRRALPFIAYLVASSLGTVLFESTDTLVIGAMPELGVSQIAAYDVGTRWQRLVRPFVEAFILALSPGLVALAARGDHRRLQENVTAHIRQILLLGMVPTVAVACVAGPFVTHWVGEQFVSRSVPVMWLALASAVLWGPGPYCSRVLIAVSRLRFATIGGVVAGLVNLLLSIVFVRGLGLGLVGVAGANVLTVFLWCDVALAYEVCVGVGLRPLTYLREVWLRPCLTLPVMILFGAGLVSLWPPRSLIEVLVQLCVSGTALTAIAVGIGLTRGERSMAAAGVGRLVDRFTKGRLRR